jgi:hypothetical protein
MGQEPTGMVIVPPVIETVPPLTMDVLDRFSSAPEVPTVPSMTPVPALFFMRNQPAVPVAAAVTEATVLRLPLPDANAANAVADRVNVASSVPVTAVPGSVGWVPVRTSMVPAPPAFSRAVIASPAALRAPG